MGLFGARDLDVEHHRQRWSLWWPGRRFGFLRIRPESEVRRLPWGLRADYVFAPDSHIESIGPCTRATHLVLSRTPIRSIPASTRAEVLDLSDCGQLGWLPPLRLRELDCTGCTSLGALPEALEVGETLSVSDCARLQRLPSMPPLRNLSVAGCPLIAELPDDLVVHEALELGGSGVRALPPGVRGATITWDGVPLRDPEILQTARPDHIARVRDEAMREALVDIVGLERFAGHARPNATLLDRDTDPGGPRRLYCARLQASHYVYWLEVRCPSTGHRHLLRVPPYVADCGEAAAWLSGTGERRMEFEVET